MINSITDLSIKLSDDFPASLITMNTLNKELLLGLFSLADEITKTPDKELKNLYEGKVLASLFYQPSTRTRLNFESAAQRLGLSVIGFSDPLTTRAGDYYQESLEDVVRFTSEICDVIALRHFESGAAERAANHSIVPVINAGDGYNQHPTQAIGDLFTMHLALNGLEGKTIGLIGDANVRSLKAITIGLATLGVTKILFKHDDSHDFPVELLKILNDSNICYEFYSDLVSLMKECHLVETIGINHPDHSRPFDASGETLSTDSAWIIDRSLISKISGRIPYILHPGPRTNEISAYIDGLPEAIYFKQAHNGMITRMAIMSVLLSRSSA